MTKIQTKRERGWHKGRKDARVQQNHQNRNCTIEHPAAQTESANEGTRQAFRGDAIVNKRGSKAPFGTF